MNVLTNDELGAKEVKPVNRGYIAALCVLTLSILVIHSRCSRETSDEVQLSPRADGPFAPIALSEPTLDEQRTSEPEEKGEQRLLLLGFDREDGGIGRTDAILIIVVKRTTDEVGVISVPRDLWVDVPGFEPARINTVVRTGERFVGPGHGLPLLRRVLDEQLGLSVDGAVAVSFQGFTEIIDGLGGIEVDVRCPIEDNFISAEAEGGYERLSLEEGPQHLGGRTALLYSRSRHGRSDTDRSFRQQAVLLGIKKKVLRVESLSRLPALWRALSGNAETDLDLSQALSFAGAAASADLQSVHGLVLTPPVVTESRSPDGKWIVLLDRGKLDEAVSHLFDAPLPGSRGHMPCPPADVALHWKAAPHNP